MQLQFIVGLLLFFALSVSTLEKELQVAKTDGVTNVRQQCLYRCIIHMAGVGKATAYICCPAHPRVALLIELSPACLHCGISLLFDTVASCIDHLRPRTRFEAEQTHRHAEPTDIQEVTVSLHRAHAWVRVGAALLPVSALSHT